MNRKKIRTMTLLLCAVFLTACGAENPAATSAPLTGETQNVSITKAPETEAATTAASMTEAAASESSAVIYGPGKEDVQPSSGTAESGEAAMGIFTGEDLIFVYDGVRLEIGQNFAALAGQFKEAPREERGQACIGGGFDINYYFGEDEAAVYTLGDTGAQIIYDIFVSGEGLGTPKGAVIGQTKRPELAALYGAPASSMAATDRYSIGDITVSFTFHDGVLSQIDYLNTRAGQ